MKYFFPLKYFCQNVWYGHVECTSYKLARKNSRIGQNFSLNFQEQWKENFKKKLSLKTFFWTPREKLVLTTLTETIRQQAEKFSFNVRKRKEGGYSKKIPQNVLLDSDGKIGFDKVDGNYLTTRRKFFTQGPKMIRKVYQTKNFPSNLSFGLCLRMEY